MRIAVESIESAAAAAEAARIRREVFQREWDLDVEGPDFRIPGRSVHLLARVEKSGAPIATLTVTDTTGDEQSHARFALPWRLHDRSARYTHLAVLKPYRGLDIPLRLLLEAKQRIVGPGGYDYTWLLFHADRAENSSLCRRLRFQPSHRSHRTGCGWMRLLTRDESHLAALDADRTTADYLAEAGRPHHADWARCAFAAA